MSPKPTGLIEPWRSQIDLEKLARLLYDRYRGRALRVKIRDLATRVLGVAAGHGSAPEVALRTAIHELRSRGLPIGTLDGPDGGVFWIASEDERRDVLRMLYAQRQTLLRTIAQLQAAPLHWRPLPGQTSLLPEDR
jgi:hypothetical protein